MRWIAGTVLSRQHNSTKNLLNFSDPSYYNDTITYALETRFSVGKGPMLMIGQGRKLRVLVVLESLLTELEEGLVGRLACGKRRSRIFTTPLERERNENSDQQTRHYS